MKKISKKLIVALMAAIICLNINIYNPKAADVSISIALSATTISIGNSVSATISVSGSSISAYTFYVTYDSSVLQYSSASGSAQVNGSGGTLVMSGTGAGSATLSFKAIANGKSGISTSGSEAYNLNLEQLSVSHAGVNVTVKTDEPKPDPGDDDDDDKTTETSETTESTETSEDEDDGRSSNCNLSSLEISPGILEPAFSPDVTSYFVQVDEDVTSMVVSAKAEDSKATTEVYGAGLIELGENSVRITVTAENGAVKVYKLRVVAGEDKGEAFVEIDGKEYRFVSNENSIENPEGYTKTTAKYMDWEVMAFESPNKLIKIVCLVDDEDNYSWYMINEDKNELVFYQEYSSTYIRYVILPFPEDVKLSDDYKKVPLNINEQEVEAYQSDRLNDNMLYVVYAMNIEDEAGLYLYDDKYKTFMRYVEGQTIETVSAETVTTEAITVVATPMEPTSKPKPDDSFFNKTRLKVILIIVSILTIALIGVVIWLIIKNRKLAQEVSDADDMLASVTSGKVDSSLDTSSNEILEDNLNEAVELVKDTVADTVEATADNQITEQNAPVENIPEINTISQDDSEIFIRESERINTLIKENYDANKDSAF